MSLWDAKQSASIASNQAIAAVNVIQTRAPRVAGDKYEENLALAVSNLAVAVRQIVEHLEMKR